MKIGRHDLDRECFLIAEVGLAHEGSIGQAHAFIDAVSKAGVDAVKFQCHTGQPDQPWRQAPLWNDGSRKEYWDRTGFTPEQWKSLARHVQGTSMEFLCSPFSAEAVEILKDLVPAWKIASGQVTNTKMLEACSLTGKPGIISMGLGTSFEVSNAARYFEEYALMVSTPLYPTPADAVGLSRLLDWRDEIAGLSDHSGTLYPSFAAAALGADLIEVHVTMSRHSYGPDTVASLTIEELGKLVEGVRFIEKAVDAPSAHSMAVAEGLREVYLA